MLGTPNCRIIFGIERVHDNVVDDRILRLHGKVGVTRRRMSRNSSAETLINDELVARNMTVAGFSRAPSKNGEISINAKPGDGGDATSPQTLIYNGL